MTKVWLVCLCCVVVSTHCAPLQSTEEGKTMAMEEIKQRLKEISNFPGLDKEEYLRYWQEMAKNDPNLMKHLNNIRHGEEKVDLQRMIEENPLISERLAHGSEDIRSRLEEAKRLNVEEMRQLQRLQMLRQDNTLKDGDWNTKLEALREKLPAKFTDKDIQSRIKEQNRVLETIDQKRREEFKKSEMQAEHKRRELLKAMDEKKRLEAEEAFQAKREKLKHHEKIHHPASEEQLEDIWEKEDGLDRSNFDPKTFFHLHDKNSDKHLDAVEWEALFFNEMRKVYGDDMGGMEAHEDLARMREHVTSEMDKDGDGLVSLDEFIQYTKDPEYKEDEEWKSVAEKDNFSDPEFEKYETEHDDYYDYEYDTDGNLIGYKTKQNEAKHDQEPEDNTPNKQDTQSQDNQHGDPGISQANEQGHIPNQDVPEAGQPSKENVDTHAEVNVPQVAVHVNGMENVDKGVPVDGEQVPKQNPNEV